MQLLSGIEQPCNEFYCIETPPSSKRILSRRKHGYKQVNGYYAVLVLFFLIYVYGDFIRESQRDKKDYATYAILSALAILGLCAYLTISSATKIGVYEPFWFEDTLLLDLLVVMALLFLWKTRKIHIRGLYFRITAIAVFLFLSFSVCEVFLRIFYVDNLCENRIGREYERVNYNDVDIMLHKPIPEAGEISRLNKENIIMMEVFSLADRHVVPVPEKADGEKRIVWLGDSMTEAAQVPWEKRFPHLLEESVGGSHYVLAVGSTSTDFAKVMIDRFFDLIQPDIVLLGFYPLNDYIEFGRPYSDCGFAPLFVPEGDGFKYNCGDNPGFIFSDVYTQPANALFHYAAYKTVFGNVLMDFRRSAYLKVAEVFYDRPNPFETRAVRADSYVDNEDAVCSMVNEINRYVAERGAVFGAVMIPYVLGDDRYISNKEDIYPPELYGNAFLDCMSHGDIPFFNLHEAFNIEDLDINNPETVFFRDRHFNESGNRKAAELLAPFERRLLKINE